MTSIKIGITTLASFALCCPQAQLAAQDKKPATEASISKAEQRGTLEDRSEKVRGDAGKWSDFARLQVSPQPPAATQKDSLDQWGDSLAKKQLPLTPSKSSWLIYRTEQLDDNDRVWLESIERSEDGIRITITFARATWLGYYSKNFTWYSVTGVNLGKLPAGKYEVTWIEKRLEFKNFIDPKNRRNSWPADEKESASAAPLKTKLNFQVRES